MKNTAGGVCQQRPSHANSVALKDNAHRSARHPRPSPAHFFRRKNGAPTRAQPSNRNGRPITRCVIGRAKRAEKESEDQRIELARFPGIHSLFHSACRNKPTQNCLSGGAWGGALGSKAASPIIPRYSKTTLSCSSFSCSAFTHTSFGATFFSTQIAAAVPAA